jgi:hypothetical protein
MATRRTILRSAKSITGTAVLVLGTFILYQNLAGGAARVSQVLTNGTQAFGVLPAVVLAAAQPAHAYAADHHRFLQTVFHELLSSSWPLLLVIFGSVLSRETFREQSKHIEENNKQLADLPHPCPTYNFAKSRRAGNQGDNGRCRM